MLYIIILSFIFLCLLIIKLIEIYYKYKKSKVPIHTFNAVISDNKKTRSKGLMNRKKKLKHNEGMLFSYKKEQNFIAFLRVRKIDY